MSKLRELREKLTVEHPRTIRDKVAAWAFEENDSVKGVIRYLEDIDCAACFSPAPIYYHDMAAEFAEHWPEIDQALDSYRDGVGESWHPKPDASVLNFLWFAYEWAAYELAGEIRHDIELSETAEKAVPRSPSEIAATVDSRVQDNGGAAAVADPAAFRFRSPSEIAAERQPVAGAALEAANDNGHGF